MNKKMRFLSMFLCLVACLLGGCVNQHPEGSKDKVQDLRQVTKIKNPKVIATSMATVYILEKLNVDLIGVPDSKVDKLPDRYKGKPTVGMAMAPEIEKIETMNPDWIFSPVSLVSDLEPKYENAGLRFGFLNLNNIPGMYKSIEDMGVILDREKEAKALIDEYQAFMKDYKEKHKNMKKKKVLVLMGLPGSYVVATDKSYVGSLVELAGGENIYKSDKDQFINVTTEDMLKKNPEIILRTAHALPDEVKEMFFKEFKTNQIWSKFDAVKNDKVYDLDYKKFGMSAKFTYPKALQDLGKIFETGGDK
ncbi:ABC transporter substrate-binding protein [Peptostreptococcus sp. MV1]|uniref:heme ABC transporter substrate-binding protein IsdE n=1 Tax=Peptostreptococcus sp. MV1 TaxID=1219626 RepID=UPI00051005C9|nr:heme ABC transporter substrate-binding protein IsdE [Peptostreptococcus sp. MV1]KGF10534.1 ABC transporter substrate-binding protein [Peptostreptococcus sp. MV1]